MARLLLAAAALALPLAESVRTLSEDRIEALVLATKEDWPGAATTAPPPPTDAKGWLARGAAYINHAKLSKDARAYLEGSAAPIRTWKGSDLWEEWLINAMENLPETGVQVDDHQGTPIGEGESIGVVAAEVVMDRNQIALLPSDFQSGLFQTCGAACGTWPAVVRVSHTKAAGLDLMRIALAIGHPKLGTVNVLFTETLKSFPIAGRHQLEAFAYQVKHGPGPTLLKYPVALAAMAQNALKAAKTYGEASKQAGALGKDFYSLTPYLIGGGGVGRVGGAMKFRLVPATGRAPFPAVPEGSDMKAAMRSQLVEQVSAAAHSFSLEIQVATDPEKQPVNDASHEWEEATAPWVPMGTLTIPQQAFPAGANIGSVVGSGLWQNGALAFNSKELLFAPGETPHRPIGDINAFRTDLYPIYDKRRQVHLLGKAGGVAAKCPFASIADWLR